MFDDRFVGEIESFGAFAIRLLLRLADTDSTPSGIFDASGYAGRVPQVKSPPSEARTYLGVETIYLSPCNP